MNCHKLQLIAVSATSAALAVGGMIVYRWFKHRDGNGRHSHHHGHGHGSRDHGSHGHGSHDHISKRFDDVNVWLASHYGPAEVWDSLANIAFNESMKYNLRLAKFCQQHTQTGRNVPKRALDIGCNIGSLCFELASFYDEVVGVDVSEVSLATANKLKSLGKQDYTVPIEGDITKEYTAVVNPDIDRSRVRFINCGADDLPSDIGRFGLVVLSLTLHHLPNPKAFLENVADLVVPYGILVISETYTWHEMLDLPKDQWISGYTNEQGEEVQGREGLNNLLQSKFYRIAEQNYPYPTKIKARMCLIAAPHVTCYVRKDN